MKKILFTVSFALSMGLCTDAQVLQVSDGYNRYNEYIYVVPAELTTNGKPVVYTKLDNVITIYDENFNVAKKIELNENYTNSTLTEEAIVQPTGVKVVKEPTTSEAPEWAKSVDVSTITSAEQFAQAMQSAEYPEGYVGFSRYRGFVDYNGNFCCRTDSYYNDFNHDSKYPVGSYYCLVNGIILSYYHNQSDYEWDYSVEGAEWTEVSNYSYGSGGFGYSKYTNFDNNLYFDDNYYITQNLFNSDDAWEYIVPFGSTETTVSYSVNQVTDAGLQIYRKTSVSFRVEGYRVMSDNGKVVLETPMYIVHNEFWRINGEVYLCIGRYALYRLNELSSAIQQLEASERGEAFVKVANGNIDLQLSDDDTDSQVVLTDMGGQTVGRRRIAKGETSASIDSGLIGKGVYNVSIQRGGQVLKSQNVLVR